MNLLDQHLGFFLNPSRRLSNQVVSIIFKSGVGFLFVRFCFQELKSCRPFVFHGQNCYCHSEGATCPGKHLISC